uniref:Centrosomal P4.1-associated protein n=1 Tax=Astyanax mexicanus TaxID=7994 RepID=W5KUR8_ASTMX
MSSPAGPQPSESRFLSRWMPSSSRAGVFLSGSPGEVSSVQSSCSSLAQEISMEDSFCSQFAPLPVSCSSSLDSLVPKVSEIDPQRKATSSNPDSVQDILTRVQELPLQARLEQLKQLQQRMQEQLKAHQLEQLQKLHNEQQGIVGMVQTGAAGYTQEKQQYSRSTSSTLSTAQHSALPTHQEEVLSELESSVWNHESSVVQSSFGQDGDGDEDDMIEGSLQSVIENPSMCRQDRESEPQDRPLKSATSGKTFEEMLEEQLKLENEKINKNAPAEPAKVKRPFLRRGEGLARFKRDKASVTFKEGTARPSTKPTSCPNPVKSQGQALASRHQNSEPKRPSPKPTPTNTVIQRKTAVLNKENLPQSKSLLPASKTVVKAHILGSHQGQNMGSGAVQQLGRSARRPDPPQKIVCDAVEDVNKGPSPGHLRDPSTCVADNSFEVWLAERGDRWEKDNQRECVELGEFELLERAADELSFSSNSSFICTLLQGDRRRLSSTPVKSPPKPKLPGHIQADSRNPVQPSISSVQQGVPDMPVDSVAVNIKKSVLVSQYSEEEDEGSKIDDDEDSDASLCSTTEFQQTAFGPGQPFSHCFQISQVPPYNKSSYQDREEGAASPLEEEESNGDSTIVDAKDHIDFDDDDTWNEPEDLTCISAKMDDHAGTTLKRKVAFSKGPELDPSADSSLGREPEPLPTCQLVAKLFPALKPKPCPPAPPVAKNPEATCDEQGAAQSRLLRERLVELETEIERFKTENAVLSRLRQENEDVRENLRKETAQFQQKMADELAKWEEFKREESRKLQREKKLFEKHAAAARARPDKQERDEMQSLKQQLNSLQEDLRKREARWSSTHQRLRQQVDTLSAENTTLRGQVRMLEKLRLTAWKNAESEREKEKARGRSNAPGGGGGSTTSVTAQRRAKSKSPSHSVKTSSTSSKRESPELQNPHKIQACKSRFKPTLSEKEACPVADPYHISDGQPEPEGRSHDSLPINESSLEVESPRAVTEQLDMEQEEITHTDGKIEKLLPDGGRLIVFPNGTRKELSADGLSIKVTFFNGDIKHIMPDQRVIYYYAGAQTTHTTYPDGIEVLQFPNNQIEKHFPDGHKEITFPDQTVKNIYPDGREESVLADGTIIQQNPDGSKKIQFNNGQRELHTAEFKRREYPDGTVKTVYSDGRQETRYPSGRVRLKDPQGRVVMDAKP